MFEVRAIGFVESCFPDKFGVPRQGHVTPSAMATLRILPAFQPEFSLSGLEGFSHVWILFHFHLNSNKVFTAKIHPPRLEGQSIGVFATRSPHHPNAIGMTLAKIERFESDAVVVSGMDLVDGTPVIDIKPYVPESDRPNEYRGGWTQEVISKDLTVAWSDEAENTLMKLATSDQKQASNSRECSDPTKIKTLFAELAKEDPRPLVYRGASAAEKGYRQTHYVRLYQWDIGFVFDEPNQLIKVVEFKKFKLQSSE
jgi:tRNA-Thr(GGU) m(6)t(6)A37 methyltransferase TsaA